MFQLEAQAKNRHDPAAAPSHSSAMADLLVMRCLRPPDQRELVTTRAHESLWAVKRLRRCIQPASPALERYRHLRRVAERTWRTTAQQGLIDTLRDNRSPGLNICS